MHMTGTTITLDDTIVAAANSIIVNSVSK